MTLHALDIRLIHFFRTVSEPVARFGLFVIFFWFGALKVVGLSPASGLVEQLFEQTVPFFAFGDFLVAFGLFECLIGLLFVVRSYERLVIPLLFIHMLTTFGPLVMVPEITWKSWAVPTLEGQYIIKNLVVIATAIGIAAHLRPLSRSYTRPVPK